ncbi:MAG: TusE/DsrC/DsvC family sulfur relay protein [Candidatus Moraniibacteriota bacterium]|jgi:TusE/DsrC/DsvC family sulfur relay protein
MPVIKHKGKMFKVNAEGYSVNFNFSTGELETFADYVAEKAGIEELNDIHWAVIDELRLYYAKNGVAPMMRILIKRLNDNGMDMTIRKLCIAFHDPIIVPCKMAGLPNSIGWA